MPPDERDAASLWDMLDAARAVGEFVAGLEFADYAKDRKSQLAVEIIGEAARRVSDSFQAEHPYIPWRMIVAQRNVLAHEYGEIKQERMWLLVTTHIPDLVRKLEPLVPPSGE